MRRVLAVLALAAGVGALLSVTVVSHGGSSASTAATTTTSATPVVAPAIPCPSSGKPTPPPAPPPSNATWTGVFERVTAELNEDGSTKKTPKQLTRVSAEGSAPTTVLVPMSGKHLRRRDRGKKPKVTNGVAEIKLDPSGTKTQDLDSDFAGSLPLAVKVSFKLNGQPISASDLKGKSGSVQVSYQLANTSAKPVTVCFKGFNGATTKQTVTVPLPLIAYFSFTVPDNATQFHTSTGTVAPVRKGVGASWTVALFKPFGPTTQTFSFTMSTPKAKIPEAHVLLETLDPLKLTGKAPATSASALGRAAAAADGAAAKVQSDIAALQVKAGQPKQPRGSSRGSSRRTSSRRTLSFGTPTSALTTMQNQIVTLGNANRTFIGRVDPPTRKLVSSTRRSMSGLAASDRRTTDTSTRKVDRAVGDLSARIDRSLGVSTARIGKALTVLKAALRRSIDTPSLTAIAANAGQLQTAAAAVGAATDAMAAEMAPIAARLDDLVASLPTPVQNALALVQRFDQLKADLDALNVTDRSDPTYVKLAADLVAARAIADGVSSALADIQQRAQAVAGDVHTLQSDVASLQTRVGALEVAAVANAEGTVQGRLATAVAGLDARFAKAEAAAATMTADAKTKIAHDVRSTTRDTRRSVRSAGDAATRSIRAAETNAQRRLSASVRDAQREVLSAERSVSELMATIQAKADRALASAKHKAKAGGQATLAAARSAAEQASAAAGQAVATANADYARLLAINERSVGNQLPGGDAQNATEQNGSFRYIIKGG